jgi:hypothetical protein
MALLSAAAGECTHQLVREYPRDTLNDLPIGHVAGTALLGWRFSPYRAEGTLKASDFSI